MPAMPSFWSSTLITLLPMAFIGIMFVVFLRQLTGGRGLAPRKGSAPDAAAPEDHPFLPEHVPDQPIQKKRGRFRVVALWVVLIVMFLVIWQFLSPATTEAQHAAPPPPEPTSTWSSTVA